MGGGFGFQSFQPLRSAEIAYRGQPIALVVADTLEAAREAAALVAVEIEASAFARPRRAGARPSRSPVLPLPFRRHGVGDADAALARAAVRSMRATSCRHSTRTRWS